ncbi:MAG TPA: hypothetical protein VHU84_03320, partial [Lacipirellulaceae bacterium]|nr:hypothetical protein [Lacipirellulaceae bacterium]
ETVAFESLQTETPEEAAQRIDAWFRSAQTLPEVPPITESSQLAETAAEQDAEPETAADLDLISGLANDATADLDSHDADDLDATGDYELDVPSEDAQNVPPWDDSQHMDKLLAEIQDQPVDEYIPSDPALAAEAKSESEAEASTDWMPDEPLPYKSSIDPKRGSRSVVRTLVMSAVGGLMGLGLGYYALLWMLGPKIDVLEAAKYLPKAMLPSSFSTPARQLATMSQVPLKVEDEKRAEPTNDVAVAPADESAKPSDALKPTDAPAEKLASFTEPVGSKKGVAPSDDRYATAAATDKPAEPAAFNAPPAAPVTERNAASKAPPVLGAPTFTATELGAAIAAAKEAETGLVNGNLTDGRDVARTKGFSYSILADLAQKVTFVDGTSADVAKLQHEAEEIFQATLATPHARDEVAQIVPKWITSPNRRQGGVFFAGSILNAEQKGSVSESNVDLGNGQSLPVLLTPAVAEQLKGLAGPVAVLGWIVEKPAAQVSGYTGTAPQAVFAGKLVPLQ